MPEYCTCGAQLPPDARFCHKCGKPQRDEDIVVEEPVVAAPPQLPPPVILPIGFRNGLALRAALFAGGIVSLLAMIAGPLTFFVSISGGFLAVYIYRRRTSQPVTALSGAYLGWISGIFTFVVMAPLIVTEVTRPGAIAAAQEQMKNYPFPQADLNQTMAMMHTVPGIVAMLMGLFMVLTMLPALGGAMGARILRSN